MEGGGVAIINEGGGGRLGSAARSNSSTSKRKSNKIGIFRAGTIYSCRPPLLLRFGPKYTLLGSKLVRKQICLSGIFPARQLNAIVTPSNNAM